MLPSHAILPLLLPLALCYTLPQTKDNRPLLSTATRSAPPRSYGLFSYSRHPSGLPPFDPLHGIRDVLVHKGKTEDSHQIGLRNLERAAVQAKQAHIDNDRAAEPVNDSTGSTISNSTWTRMHADKVIWTPGTEELGLRSLGGEIWDDWVDRGVEGDRGLGRRGDGGGDDDDGGGKGWGSGGRSKSGGDESEGNDGNDGSDAGGGEGKGGRSKHTSGGSDSGGYNSKGHNGGQDGEDEGGGERNGAGEAHGSNEYGDEGSNGSSGGSRGSSGDDGGGQGYEGHNGESGYDEGDNGESGGRGDGGGSGGGGGESSNNGHTYDDGQYHPGNSGTGGPNGDSSSSGSSRTEGYQTDSDGSSGSGDGSGSDDLQDDPSPSGTLSSWSTSSTAGYRGGGAHRLAQSTYGEPSASDCSRLGQFYRSMVGSGWTKSDGWNDDSNTECCTWFGVSCSTASRVTAINLPNNGLSGVLSSYLFALSALLRVDISSNSIASLPDHFDSLTSLTHFSAGSCNITGSIPTSLLSSSSIVNIDLSNNSFSGDVVLDSTSLYSINLAHNQLESIEVQAVKSLSKVYLASNGFTGTLPDLSDAAGLSTYDASYNNTGSLFDISHLQNLTRFDVRANQLTGPFPSSLSTNTKLTSLYLSSNSLSGPWPTEEALNSLVSCYVMPNNISPCPSASELADQNSLAHRCHLSCPASQAAAGSAIPGVGASTRPASGIPVSPLPGESLGLPQAQSAGEIGVMGGVNQQSPVAESGNTQSMRSPAVVGADSMGVSSMSNALMRKTSASQLFLASLTFAIVLLDFS